MDIVVHAGAHFTEEERILKTLLRNKAEFAKLGISIPGPSRYRGLLRETMAALDEGPAAPDARDVLIDAILDDAHADRLILSHSFLFGAPRACLRDGRLYDLAPSRLSQLAHIFDTDRLEIFIALRNPATFLPALYAHSPQEDLDSFMRGTDPRQIRWSDTLEALRGAAPNVALTVWCFEDMPLIWGEIISEMAALEHGTRITGGFDLLATIISREGMQRFRAYLHDHPDMGERRKRRVIEAFLMKYALDEEIEEELEMPGWTEDLVDELTLLYEDDMDRIPHIPGVTMLGP